MAFYVLGTLKAHLIDIKLQTRESLIYILKYNLEMTQN